MKPLLTINRAHFAKTAWVLALLFVLASFPLTYFDWQGRWHTLGHERSYFLKLWSYWVQYALLPVIIALSLGLNRRLNGWSALRVLWIGVLASLFWAGQIEPHLLTIRHTTVKTTAAAPAIKIALLADIHWGLFVRDWQLQRLVNELNELDVDAIFVAGDWTYEPKLDLIAGFAPLAQLKKPVFAVLGNHDVERPGPKLSQALRSALQIHGVQLMEGKSLNWKGWQIIGLDDLWGGRPAQQVQTLFASQANNRIVLTHQPDTVALLPKNAAQITLAGHTHGGQVNLPYITAHLLKKDLRMPWYNGLYASRYGQVFVTPGTGMVGLPLRFAMPPRIDVLHLSGH